MGKRVSLVLLTIALSFVIGGHPPRAQETISEEHPDDILIVANRGTPIQTISRSDLRNIFLGLRTLYKDGQKIVPINAREGTALRAAFQQRVLHMTAEQEGRHWENQKIRKGVYAPVEFSNQLKAVFKLRNSLSYIFRSQYTPGVAKIVSVIPSESQ